jgi:hypothetical protein
MVIPTVSPLSDSFFEAYSRWGDLERAANEVPAPMRDGLPYGDSTVGRRVRWRPIPVAQSIDYAALEERAGFELPPSFKSWHSRRHTVRVDLALFTLASLPLAGPLTPLSDLLFDEDYGSFLLPRGLLPFGYIHLVGYLCFDAASTARDGEWPIRLYAPTYFADGAPDHVRWRDDAAIGPVVFSSFDALLSCSTAMMEGPDDGWGALPRRFAEIDPRGAGAVSALAFWMGRVREYGRSIWKPAQWRRFVAICGSRGPAAQRRLQVLADHALMSDPVDALAIAPLLVEREFETQGRILHAEALQKLGRSKESAPIVLDLARAWLGPTLPFAPNQYLGRSEMLELLRPLQGCKAASLRLQVISRPKPQVA